MDTVFGGNPAVTCPSEGWLPVPCQIPPIVLAAFPVPQLETLQSRDYVLVFANEDVFRNRAPDRRILDQINLDVGGIVVTARDEEVDFVSRNFTPQASIFEGPVTGSAHCSLIPYWSERHGKESMRALQLSARVGKLHCRNAGDRVLIAGKAITYPEGHITI
jgi:predicted PhzF superfamily epimerase YddE/YHI9